MSVQQTEDEQLHDGRNVIQRGLNFFDFTYEDARLFLILLGVLLTAYRAYELQE